jgi:hypothetical protein
MAVQPWAKVGDDDCYDLPPAVRAGRETRTPSYRAEPVSLERSAQDVFRAQIDDDLEYLDKPTFVRKLAD